MVARRDWLVLLSCVAAAAGFIAVWQLAAHLPGGFDVYMHYYPNMEYAARQLLDGGRGLLWNPYQSCGEPFFGISSTGLLYPPYWLFLLLDPQHAHWAVTLINLTIAGVGAFALGRTLGVSRGAALCGAIAFELGNATLDVNTWSPMVGSPYVWLPAALCCCERILRGPSLRMSAALAIVLAFALLPGFPQIVLFAYQLIALRVGWEFATRRVPRPWATVLCLALGLGLPLLLTAVQLFPGLETAALSIRNRHLTLNEMLEGNTMDWARFRVVFGQRLELFNPFAVVPLLLAAAAPFRKEGRRITVFYLLAGLLYWVLSFGPNTWFFDWYLALPMSHSFRGPTRFMWVTSFCLAVLTAIGADAFARHGPSAAPARERVAPIAPLAAAIGLYFLSPSGLWRVEWVLVVALGVVGIWTLVRPTPRWGMSVVLGAVAVDLLAFPVPSLPQDLKAWSARPLPMRGIMPDPALLLTYRPVFDDLQRVLTPQDRAAIIYNQFHYTVMPKSASLFSVPAIQDYEPAPSERSADYAVMMRTGVPLHDLRSFYYGGGLASPLPGPLLNLAAARYLIIDLHAPDAERATKQLRAIGGRGGVGLYVNPDALPRAYFVPLIEVVSDPEALLQQLANGRVDPRQVALVESPPPSGFTGVDIAADGTVEFVTNDPERVVLRVHATKPGFLHLTDQYFPGWRATVNGTPAPILRANFLFRAVEVPAGDSLVEFRYVPMSLYLGAAVSLLSGLALGAALIVSIRRRR
jgi:hypothetical protein